MNRAWSPVDPPNTSHAKNDPLPQMMRALILSFAFARNPTKRDSYIYECVVNCHPKYLMQIRNRADRCGLSVRRVTNPGTLLLTVCSYCKMVTKRGCTETAADFAKRETR